MLVLRLRLVPVWRRPSSVENGRSVGATGAADPDTLTAGRAHSDNGKGFPSFNRGHEKRAPASGGGVTGAQDTGL